MSGALQAGSRELKQGDVAHLRGFVFWHDRGNPGSGISLEEKQFVKIN